MERPVASTRGVLVGDSSAPPETFVTISEDHSDTISDFKPEDDDGITVQSRSSTSTNGHYDPKADVILWFEYITSTRIRVTKLYMMLAITLGFVFLVMNFVLILTKDGRKLPGFFQFRFNVAIGAICLTALILAGGKFLRRVVQCNIDGRTWSLRRKRAALLFGFECLIQSINVIFYLIPNINVLVDYCNGVFSQLVAWCALGRWTCWNTLFLLFCVHARNIHHWKKGTAASRQKVVPVDGNEDGKSENSDGGKIMMDAPLWIHWPLLPMWMLLEGVIIGASVSWALYDQVGSIPKTDGSCSAYLDSWGGCHVPPYALALSISIDVLSFLFLLLYVLLISHAACVLQNEAYHANRMGNQLVRLQMKLRGEMMCMFVLTISLQWFVRPNSCRSYVFIWFGILPIQVVQTAISVVYISLATPMNPAESVPILQVWLQEFAWTEEDLPKRIEERSANLPGSVELRKEPMFCFQTMMNCLYWSALVYSYEEEAPSLNPELSLEVAMSLYRLENSELIWEKAMDTKLLLAWRPGTILIAFRGTASMQNALADIDAWQAIHPPRRGSFIRSPRVHKGFLRSWHVNGLAERVIQRVGQVLDASCTENHPRIILTGHSLGGALATLAAYDIAMAAKARGFCPQLCVYTFGQPRVGNHAFAQEYSQMVPNAWSVINDQDIVARRGKLGVLYKRGGHRVILDPTGDMIVRPSVTEISLHLTFGGGSIPQHYLGSYQQSILAILLSQFTQKGSKGCRAGVYRLALACPPAQMLLEKGAGLDLEALRRLERMGITYKRRLKLRVGKHGANGRARRGSNTGTSSSSKGQAAVQLPIAYSRPGILSCMNLCGLLAPLAEFPGTEDALQSNCKVEFQEVCHQKGHASGAPLRSPDQDSDAVSGSAGPTATKIPVE